jgi:outer membrane protein TolC
LYEGDLDTVSAGEFGLGIALPLVRDRAIDETRAKIASSELGVKGAEAKVQQSQIAVLREARSAYWTWIAANLQQKVIANLVSVAEVRNTQLEAAVRAGDKPEFDLTDNSRTIFKRQSELAKAEQIKAKSAIQLSLYYRDEDGSPIVPSDSLVPASLAHNLDVNSLDESALVDEALRSRPELQALDAKEKKAGLQVALGENLLKPRVDLKLGGYHPSGTGEKRLVEDELKVGLKFEVPLELNKPRGMISEGLAQKEAVSQKTRLVRDKIAAEIKKTLTTLQLAEQRITAARESRIAADKVAEGERVRFEHGDSNLVFVVLREQTAAEAALEEIGALLDFHLVHADLLAALGQG